MPTRLSVSVVIPCYNVERYVEECVESVLAQSYKPKDIICVDDGSSDSTLEKLRGIEERTGGYVQVIATENRGASAARNTGMRRAEGEYIQFLDADDLLYPGKLEHQVNLLKDAATKPDLIAGCYEKMRLDGHVELIGVSTDDPWLSLLSGRLGCTCSNLWRTDHLRQVGFWNEDYPSSQNTELAFRMLQQKASILADDTSYTLVRKRQSSIGHLGGQWATDNKERYFRVRADIMRYLDAQGMLTEERMKTGRQLFFELIRSLFEFDRQAAITLHNRIFNSDFTPRIGFNTRLYILCYKLFGFEMAEKIRICFLRLKSAVGGRVSCESRRSDDSHMSRQVRAHPSSDPTRSISNTDILRHTEAR